MDNFDPQLVGEQIARCLDYQVSHEDTEFFEEIIDCLKGGHIFGNGYEGVYPKFDRQGKYLRPLLKTSDFWDVLPIAGARRATKSLGVFVREFETIEQLQKEQKEKKYKNVGEIHAPASTGEDPYINWHKQLLQECGMTDWEPDNNNVEVIHYFSGGHVITFADRKVILRNSNDKGDVEKAVLEDSLGSFNEMFQQPFPYDMPIVQYKYMPIPLEFFAMGIPEVLEVLQEDKNLIRSARRDNIDLCIQKILKVRSGADINYDMLKFYPSAIWPLENLADVEEFEMNDVTQSSYQEEAMREKDMENALSLFGYARGMTPQHQEQPTTVMKLQQASLNRLDLNVKLSEFGFLQNIATRIILLTRRYMEPATYENIIGDKDAGFFRLNEEDIRRFYYFKPVGSSVTHIKELRQQQIQYAMQLLGNINPEMMIKNVEPFTVDWYQAAMTALEAADVRNRDRILVKLQQQSPQQQPQQMMGMPQGNEMDQLAQIMYGGGQGGV
jgi:hypothetical protein